MMYLHTKVEKFLKDRNWKRVSSKGDFDLYLPPDKLGFSEDYTVKLLTDTTKKDYEEYTEKVVSILSNIYEINSEDLKTTIYEQGEIISIRVLDEETKGGSVSLSVFDDWLGNLKELLFETAEFTLYPMPYFDRKILEAESYLNECRFLQTQKGSFVTRILLPSKKIIRQTGLFGDSIKGEDINRKLYSVLNFINQKIFISPETELEREFLKQNKDFINFEISKTVSTLFRGSNFRNTIFTFINNYQIDKVEFKEIDSTKIEKLDNFIKFVESQVEEEPVNIEATGYVTQLSIKERDYEKNTVKLLSLHPRLGPLVIKIKLDEVDYYKAIDAHRDKRRMFFKGKIVKLKNMTSGYKAVEVYAVTFESIGKGK